VEEREEGGRKRKKEKEGEQGGGRKGRGRRKRRKVPSRRPVDPRCCGDPFIRRRSSLHRRQGKPYLLVLVVDVVVVDSSG
jgi:hypothetical protein